MAGNPPSLFEFGPFTLDARERLLLCEGEVVKLRPKVFDTLRVLVENHGHLIEKDRLLRIVWQDRIVEEGNLAHNVSVLRKTLGKADPSSAGYLETVPSKGYRFVGEVKRASGNHVQLVGLAPRPSPPPSLLVDREKETASLCAWLERADHGSRQFVLVCGEAGLGKTTLVEAFIRQIRNSGRFAVGCGQCLQGRGPEEPYSPILEALEQIHHEHPTLPLDATLSHYAPSWLAQMPGLCPQKASMAVHKKVTVATPQRMLREMVSALTALTTETPILMVLEDLQWSDHPTLDLLTRLAIHQGPARLFLLGTLRYPEGSAGRHPVYALARDLTLKGLCQTIHVRPLTQNSIETYLHLRFPNRRPSPGLLESLHRQSGGNPLFMICLLESWMAQDLLSCQGQYWTLEDRVPASQAIPNSLRDLIEQKLEQLTPEDRELVEAASVSGIRFSAAEVAAAVGLTVEAVEKRCLALMRKTRLFRRTGTAEWPDGSVSDQYAFAQELYQKVCYHSLPSSCLRRFHLQIGLRLEAAYRERLPEQSRRLADHFLGARDYGRVSVYRELQASPGKRREKPARSANGRPAPAGPHYSNAGADRRRTASALQFASGSRFDDQG